MKEDLEKIAQTLCSILDDDNVELWQLHKAAAKALGEIRAGVVNDTIQALIKTLTRTYQPNVTEQAQIDIEEAAKGSIVKIWKAVVTEPVKKSIVEDLIEVLRRKDVLILSQIRVVQALGEIGVPAGIDPLLNIAHNEGDIELRTAAIESLAMITKAMREDAKLHVGPG